MWMAQRQARQDAPACMAEQGEVTVAGGEPAVVLEGERRGLRRWLPGGYHWTPRRGEQVLVMKCGAEEAPCLLAVEDSREMEPGEVYIQGADGAGIHLKADGRILLQGRVQVSGSLTVNGAAVQGEEG